MNGKKALSLLALLAAALAPTRPASASTVAGPPAQPGHIVTDVYGGIAGYNSDGSNQINYSVQSGGATDPSVSRDGSKIAFQSNRGDGNNTHIYIMNGDGTGTRQLTFPGTLANGDAIYDAHPAISPDGTQVAFVSQRNTHAFPDGLIVAFTNVWVINTDGTNLHQVTQTQLNTDGNGNPAGGTFGSSVGSVVWGPDNHTLAFRGGQISQPPNEKVGFYPSLSLINADGSGERVIDSFYTTGPSASLDWSPDGRYLAYVFGDEAQGSPPIRLRLYDLTVGQVIREVYGDDSKGNVVVPENLVAGTLRFSPDSTRLLVRALGGGALDTYNLDGTNIAQITTPNDPGSYPGEPIWWASGPAIPKPDHLAVTPSPIYVPVGGTGHLTPTLYDAQGNVIVHAVRAWNLSDGRFFSVSLYGDVTAKSAAEYGPLTVTPDNGGVTAPATYVVVGTPQIAFSIQSNNNTGRPVIGGNTEISIGVSITDNGDGALTYLTLQSATLNGVPAISAKGDNSGPLPVGIVVEFAPGATHQAVIFFPASAALPGAPAVLKMGGTYVVGTFASTLRIKSP